MRKGGVVSLKTTKKCPKCDSEDVLRIQGERQGYGAGNNIRIGLFGIVLTTRYLCCSCGYIEEWVDNPGEISRIRNSRR